MGESSACLVRSLSHPSPTSQDSKEGDAIRRALTSSISFGRFLSEPLVWEKWSAFSHDRYLEDAKKYSRPGSVAEKKAYFEAHFKRIVAMKAAGSIGEQNDAVNNISELNATDEIDKEHTVEKHLEESQIACAEEDQGEYGVTAIVATVQNNSFEEREAATAHVKGVASGSEESSFIEKHVESSTHIKDINEISVNKDITGVVEEAITTVASASPNNKISISSSSKSSAPTHSQVSVVKPTVKRETPIRTKISGQAVAYSRKTTKLSVDKNRSAPKSLHMSIDFSSQPSGVKKTSSPLLQRIANSKFVSNLSKISKESTNQHTHTRGAINASAKNLPAAPQPEKGRTNSLLRQSVAEIITRDRKPKTSPMPSRSSAAHGTKERSPIVSPPFMLKSEERVAKRKEFFQKLEEKRKDQQAEMEKLQGKLKEKTRNGFEDRQPLTSQTKTNTSIDLAVNSSIFFAKKISTSQPCSPMIGKKQSTELSHNCRPQWRHTLKNHLPPANSNKLLPKKSMRENAPPNIWH